MIASWSLMTRNVMASRHLIWQLFKRDFLATYKKSFLGFTWILITPLLGIVSWVFLQKTGLLQPGNVGIPYAAYVLVGTSMWGLFIGFYEASSRTLVAGKDLVMQTNFPHEALLFKETAQHLASFLVTFVLNIAVLLAFRIIPSWGVCLFPLVALPLFLLGSAIGLIVSMIGVVAVDLSRIIGILMGLLMFVTPVIYDTDRVTSPLVRSLIDWNPLTYLVCSCRDIIIYGRLYHASEFCICAALSLVLFLVSWRLFYIAEHKLIERMI